MHNESVIDQLVADLYRAAASELPWGSPLQDLQDLFGAWGVHLHGVSLETGGVAFSYEVGGFPPEGALAYIRHYHRIDPRAAMVAQLEPGEWRSCHQLFSDDFVARDPFYQDFLIPYGGRWVSGAKLYQDAQLVAFLGIHRGRGMQPLSEDELVLGRRLGTHMAQALRLWRRQGQLQPQAMLGAALLEQLPHPVLLIDEQMGVQHANAAARERLRDDPRLSLRDGRIGFGQAQSQDEVLLALRALRLGGEASYRIDEPELPRVVLRIEGPGGGAPLALIATALRPTLTMGAFGQRSLAMVIVHDVGRPVEVDTFLAEAIFDFTPAEAAVAVGIARGRTAAQLAADHGVSLATIRTQLNAVFAKMGVNRQAEVAAALVALPAWRAGGHAPSGSSSGG